MKTALGNPQKKQHLLLIENGCLEFEQSNLTPRPYIDYEVEIAFLCVVQSSLRWYWPDHLSLRDLVSEDSSGELTKAISIPVTGSEPTYIVISGAHTHKASSGEMLITSGGHTFVFPIWQQRLGGAWVRGYSLLGNSLPPSTLHTNYTP